MIEVCKIMSAIEKVDQELPFFLSYSTGTRGQSIKLKCEKFKTTKENTFTHNM